MARSASPSPRIEAETRPVRAAEYVRMSTEHQRYSLDNQARAIRRYAAGRGYEIVQTYADAGRSGLTIEGRPALLRLLAEIEAGQAEFSALLVYDVSRLGRFQDPDEAAMHELRCRRAGIEVIYCAEPFENDGSIGSAILKAVKRIMAGEYSRELSVKVYDGQANPARRGFGLGGFAGFGLRRMVVDRDRRPRFVLPRGETKGVHSDRVILVPGPPDEVAIVREMFAWFVDEGLSEREIAERLNARGLTAHTGRPWSRPVVHELLTNEKYIGHGVWGRVSYKLQQHWVRNQPLAQVRSDGAFEAIVDPEMFGLAQAKIAARAARFTDAEMLDGLRRLLKEQGALNADLINRCHYTPSRSNYVLRFGSLLRAYALIGYTPHFDCRFVEERRRTRCVRQDVAHQVAGRVAAAGGTVRVVPGTEQLLVNEEVALDIVTLRCSRTQAGQLRWQVRIRAAPGPTFFLLVRMDPANEGPRDYYLLPDAAIRPGLLRLADRNGFALDAFRYDDLEMIESLAARTSLTGGL